MKKLVNIIKNKWYFVLLVIPFIFFCITNRTPDNDIWFILNTGRYILNNGIPYYDPFTIHEGLQLVVQQWLSSIIFFTFFNLFGKHGLLIFTIFLFFLIVLVCYKLYYLVSNDSFVSVVITSIVLSSIHGFLITRPQFMTYIILLIETYILEDYFKNGKSKGLLYLPVLSLLLINLHSSMWFLQFVILLPFIANYLLFKKEVNKNTSMKKILIIYVIVFLIGFVNPYGYKAITYVFNSYGITEINENIMEMRPSSYSFSYWKICLALVLVYMILLKYNKNKKYCVRYLFFVMGMLLLSSMHIKTIPYFIIWSGYAFSAFSFKYHFSNNIFIAVKKGLAVGLLIFLTISSFMVLNLVIKSYGMRMEIDSVVDYILDNYNKDEVILYIDFENGSYTEYRGLKSYIDGRAELFCYKYNKKEDIFKEYINITKNSTKPEMEKFVKKYGFTHLIVNADENLDLYLNGNDLYELKYVHYYDDEKELPLYRLYVLKD